MNRELYTIINLIQQNENLSLDDKQLLLNSIQKQLPILGNKTSSDENAQQILTALLENAVATIKLKNEKIAAQNRELEIENALEKVRSRAMAMQSSEELKEVAKDMRNQFSLLGQVELETCAIHLWDEASGQLEAWAALRAPDNTGEIIESNIKLKIKGISILEEAFQQYQSGKNDYVLINDLHKSREFFEAMKLISPKAYAFLAPTIKNKKPGDIKVYWSVSDFYGGSLVMVTRKQPDESSRSVLKKFANVFGLAYKRFLDLRKAEAQAREAQIETALERVRSRSMAMHKSEELKEVIKVVLEQFIHLNIKVGHAGFYIDYKAHDDMHIWLADPKLEPFYAVLPYFDTPTWNSFLEAKAKGTTLHTDLLDFKEKNKFYHSLFKLFEVPEEARKFYMECKGLAVSTVLLDSVGLYIENFDGIPYTDEENKILMQFGKVFQQTYTRFLDLHKAETQAREAQIQLSLERVRSRAMAMQKSEELLDVIKIFSDQLAKLNIYFDNVSFGINDQADDFKFWLSSAGQPHPIQIQVPYYNNPAPNRVIEAQKKGVKFFADTLTQEENKNWIQHLIDYSELNALPDKVKNYLLTSPGFARSTFILKNINLYIGNYKNISYTDEENDIFKRFAQAFEQAYTRFLDLQKAEEQAREAKIDAALEKIRSQSLAMHNSNELEKIVASLFDRLIELGLSFDGTLIYLFDKKYRNTQLWIASIQLSTPLMIDLPYDEEIKNNAIFKDLWRAIESGEHIFKRSYSGKIKNDYFRYVQKHNASKIPEPIKKLQIERDSWTAYLVAEKNSLLGFDSWSGKITADEYFPILIRFARVFEQAYTRFLDLQKAESNAREAKIESALEKVRSRTLAMQKSDELAETAAEVFKQLIGLGIEPNRLYIGIIEENSKNMEMWATDEEGSGIGKRFVFNANENASVNKLFEGWRNKIKSITVNMHGKELEDYIHYLQKLQIPLSRALKQKRRVQSVAYFDKGFIGMASPNEQSQNNVQLLERFAAVFNLTFTRFNDLKIAEAHALQAEQDLIEIKAARKKAEEALSELQATQKQLIQSEKMASLGELTAGIAHEIQNPLNFVNNFSEVSNELLEEMKTELDKENTEQAKAIAEDVKQNIEKILYHGKRADAIVKGMLQHSRTSTGQKETTNINALADEYLRLAYHGLRAKDKSFNANIKTDFDESIGSINIVPQDMGRVILNLITNAFYVVSEKKKSGSEKFEPTVSISTKKLNNKIFISIADNGTGIPQNIVDKIFQPFFTTKPTGKGTGLGLSLSYDIVKAHGGEIKVETKEGEGTIFTIQLPANT